MIEPFFSIEIDDAAGTELAAMSVMRAARTLGFPVRQQLWAAAMTGELIASALQGGGVTATLAFDPSGDQPILHIAIRGGTPPALSASGAEGCLAAPLPDGMGTVLSLALPPGTRAVTDDVLTELRGQGAVQPAALAALQSIRNQEILATLLELAEMRQGVAPFHAELEERTLQLRRANEVRAHFLSHMTHEFRTPVNSILSLTQFLLDRTDGELSGEQERQITLIRKSGERLSAMINDLLDLAQADVRQIGLTCAPCTVGDIFAGLQGMFMPMMTNPSVSLRFDAPANAPRLHSDKARIIQILRQLISNAIKYTEAGSITVSAAFNAESDGVIFTVADSGRGIAAKDHERIFEYLTPASATAQHRNKGSGLGLPLVKKIVERMGGTVTVDSSPGNGAHFSVTLPVRIREEDAAAAGPDKNAARTAAPAANPAKAGGHKALILDDEVVSYYMLKRVLKEEGYEVLEAPTYDRAAALARAHAPDVVFIDMLMPQMTGIEALELLRRDKNLPRFPVILHSHKELTDTEKAKISPEVHDILPKDIAYDALRIYVNNLKMTLTKAA